MVLFSWTRLYKRFRRSKWCRWPRIPRVKLDDIKDEWDGNWKHPPYRLWQEILRLLIVIVILVFSAILLVICIQWSDQRWKAFSTDKAPLYDLLLAHLPFVNSFHQVDGLMLSLLAIGLFSSITFVSDYIPPRIALFRRTCFILSFLLLLRTLCLSMTTLPSPLPYTCTPIEPPPNATFGSLTSQGLQLIFGSLKACTDNIFSGHATFMTLSLLLIFHHGPHRLLSLYAFFHWWAGIIMILVTRMHYSVDIILAIFITVRTWESWYWVIREAEGLELEKLRIEADISNKDECQRESAKAARRRGFWWGKKIIAYIDGVDLRVKHPVKDELLANHTIYSHDLVVHHNQSDDLEKNHHHGSDDSTKINSIEKKQNGHIVMEKEKNGHANFQQDIIKTESNDQESLHHDQNSDLDFKKQA